MRKHILPIGLLFITVNSSAQYTQSENYIATKTYLSKPGDAVQKPPVETVQYFDGLGRPKQVVNVKASPSGNDVATLIEYDGFGRQTRDYLPVPQQGSSSGAIYGNPLANVSSTPYGTERIYSEKTLENSPLNRTQSQVQVGNAWSNKPVAFEYGANTAADKVMRFWSNVYWPNQNDNDLRLETSKYFGDNQLYKNVVTDEDGNRTMEFKNGEGQTLLVRKELGPNNYADTYYVYNEYNMLSFVLSPEASKKIDAQLAGGTSTLDPSTRLIITELCYQYRYDGRNRLVEKKLPGKGWEYMVYDRADRLVMTQDANLASQGQWLITKYDKYGRVICTGLHPYGSRAEAQDLIKDMVITEERSNTAYAKSGLQIYYSRTYFYDIGPYLSVNYYDSYPSGTSFPTGDAIQGIPILKDTFPQGVTQSTKSMPTASFVKNMEDNKWTKNYMFYDKKGRPIGNYSYNHLGGYTKTESVLDFAGVVQKTETRHKRKNADTELVIKEDFFYDGQNRLLEHYHEVVGKSPVVSLAKNTYNELGQLVRKEVGRSGIDPLQVVDFSYNIRGWMKGINSGDISYNAADESYNLNNGKLFGYNIRYNDPETPYLGTERYNGNISELDWISRDVNLKRYGYKYDRLNRLLRGNYQDPGTGLPESRINDEDISYDLNGNITHLYRNSKHGKYYTPVMIDALTYTYTGNRVSNITDATNNSNGYEGGGQTITYDANGNMTAMPDKGISAIDYNFLNLPAQIGQNANVTNYYYRADGVKVRKKFVMSNASGTKTINTEYLDGFQYSTPNTDPLRRALEESDDATMAVSTAGEEEAFVPDLDRKLVAVVDPGGPDIDDMVLSFFPTAEGYYDYENFRYIYQYKDHLGNVRVSYVRNDVTGEPEIRDRNDYYPFGMSFLKPAGQVSLFDPMAIPYNYKYNGKELQETGMYDYGARMYMPDIGRWGVVDPLAEQYRRWSTYNYAMNNPVRFIDPDGRGTEDVIIKGKASGAALNELQKSVSSELTLSMSGNGKVSYTQNNANTTLSEGARKLANAINDHSVVVNINTSTDASTAILGDAFIGNKVSQSISSELQGTSTKLTIAEQALNPGITQLADDFYGKPGANTLHAVTEAYEGAKISQANGYSAEPAIIGSDGKVNNPVYDNAHNNLATPQSGPIKAGFANSFGQILPTSRGASHVSIFVQKPGDALEINSVPIPKK